MAGKSGLNLTKDEAFEPFVRAFHEAADPLRPMFSGLWARCRCRTGPRGWVSRCSPAARGGCFLRSMKASPLLRAWLARLDDMGVVLDRRWRWTGWEADAVLFDTPEGAARLTPRCDCAGLWRGQLGAVGRGRGLGAASARSDIAPFQPANMGFQVAWSEHMQRHFGHPVKGVELHAGDSRSRGEVMISNRGIEGGGLYAVSRAMRQGAPLLVDLLPDRTVETMPHKTCPPTRQKQPDQSLRKVLKLDPAQTGAADGIWPPLAR